MSTPSAADQLVVSLVADQHRSAIGADQNVVARRSFERAIAVERDGDRCCVALVVPSVAL